MRITTIINGKGGVGKTTTTGALATGLLKLDKNKYKPLAIDYDAQGNLSASYGLKEKEEPTFFHIFNGDISIEEAIRETEDG